MLNIALFGPPGAGKGTQAKRIAEKYNLVHLSTGEMIRKEIAEGTELGQMAAEVINKGQLLSDELVAKMIENSINDNKGAAGFLFDGFPRTVAQAKMLDQLLAKTGHSLKGLISIDVPLEELERRILARAQVEGRADDNKNVLANRLKEYNDKTVHVANYYLEKGLYCNIKGDRSMDEVFAAIVEAIGKMK